MFKHNFIRLSSEILKALFHNVPFSDLVHYNSIKDICILCKDDCISSKLHSILEDDVNLSNRQQLEETIKSFFLHLKTRSVTIYDVLFYFSDNMLYPKCDAYHYKYEFTDIWRSFTKTVDEELIVAAAVLLNESRRGNRKQFPLDWTYCTSSDNAELMALLNRDDGASENHFHLRGSSPYFHVSWVYLMNHVINPKYEENIRKLERNRLTQNASSIQRESLLLLWRKAAAIRLYLYLYISETEHTFTRFNITKKYIEQDILRFDLNLDLDEKFKEIERIPVQKIKDYYLKTPDSLLQYKKRCLDGMHQWLLNDVLNCENCYTLPIYELQEEIAGCEQLLDEQIDYAQMMGDSTQRYYNLQGERFLLTQVLRKIYYKTIGYERVEPLFYLYLLIKHQFRVELVQSNSRMGFYNFSEFQDRKSFFISWDFEEQLAIDTISSMIDDVRICKAELRITPEDSLEENVNTVRTYDSAIKKAIQKARESHLKGLPDYTQFFYTYHFIKIADEVHHEGQCRNWRCRKIADRKTEAILQLRLLNPDIAKRVLGIDACAAEIRCRPEVLGSVFRHLQYYDQSICTNNNLDIHQLKATYHVGEDNFDVVDSIRAIDEAILFLNLRSGSRFGHATFLGISAHSYYEQHHKSISLPKQIWLDNAVWMYHFMKENDIAFSGASLLMHFLEEQFHKYFSEIYNDALTTDFIKCLSDRIPHGTYEKIPQNSEQCVFSLYNYYLSWMLRGDEPDLYAEGYYKSPLFEGEEYKLCNSRDEMEQGRNCFEVAYLYYLYHFNKGVKDRGEVPVMVDLPEYYINGVEEIQKVLREKIARLGIAIETNPTSNLFISTIDSYDEHPVSVFYDYGLLNRASKEQMNVSINTDDKSVFSTCLSNEYAYLLFYLENKKDQDGKKLYTRFQIMQWLNQIRIMGNEQSFLN